MENTENYLKYLHVEIYLKYYCGFCKTALKN